MKSAGWQSQIQDDGYGMTKAISIVTNAARSRTTKQGQRTIAPTAGAITEGEEE